MFLTGLWQSLVKCMNWPNLCDLTWCFDEFHMWHYILSKRAWNIHLPEGSGKLSLRSMVVVVVGMGGWKALYHRFLQNLNVHEVSGPCKCEPSVNQCTAPFLQYLCFCPYHRFAKQQQREINRTGQIYICHSEFCRDPTMTNQPEAQEEGENTKSSFIIPVVKGEVEL